MNLTPFNHSGLNILLREGPSLNAEMDIVREVGREYPWDMPILTAIDIGAHIGAWTLTALKSNPDARIVACEVDPETYRVLEHNINERDGVTLVHGRAGYGTGQYALLRAPHNTGSTLAYPMMPYETVLTRGLPNGDVAYTPVLAPGRVTLEDLMALGGFDRVDVMKIDCEGAEIDLLTHADTDTLMRMDRIIGEIHTTPDEFEALTNYRLQRVGFHVAYRPHPGDSTLFYLDAQRRVRDENLHMQTNAPIAPDDDTPLPLIPPYGG
jgi:FkbM family methyltransferase